MYSLGAKNINKPLYLCGFMGAGKTTLGKQVAKALNVSFIDLDDFISQQSGKSIPDIFNSEGEESFRTIESVALHQVVNEGAHKVVALGGGAPTRSDNIKLIKENGILIFLKVPFEILKSRLTSDEAATRPLLKSDPRDIKQLFLERQSMYESNSDIIIDAAGSIKEIKDEIINEAIKYQA